MKQITEDYVSYETAQLLKEKGFDEGCRAIYEEGILRINTLCEYHNSELSSYVCAPTHQMALKWLREVHHYYIQIMLDSWACGGHLGYYVVIQKTDSDFEIMLQDVVDEVFYQTYEESCEAALSYVLKNLI